jgi:chemotaxis-related protein WspB
MLLLTFYAGTECFGIDVLSIIDVAAVPHCRHVPLSPSYFFGLCQFRGAVIPVLDLSALLAGSPSRLLFSTRLIVVRIGVGVAPPQTLGLIAEHAVQTIRYSPHQTIDPEVRIREAPYLGKVVVSNGSIIQLLSLPKLLETEVADVLFDAARYAE